MTMQDFEVTYFQAPDLTVALLYFLRQKWAKLQNSKAGKLKRFLSASTVAQWHPSFGSRAAVEEANEIREFLKSKAPKVKPGISAASDIEAHLEFQRFSQTVWNNRKHHGIVPDEFGNVSQWALQDGQLAIAFENSPGGSPVTTEDVLKARKWVAKEQRDYEQFEKKVLDENGLIRVKAKPRSRK